MQRHANEHDLLHGIKYHAVCVSDDVREHHLTRKNADSNARCMLITNDEYDDIAHMDCVADPPSMTEDELFYNMDRLGFSMFGARIVSSRDIRPEYVITAMMLENEPRFVTAGLPVIILKNDVNFGLLFFLAESYGFISILAGVIKHLAKKRGHMKDVARRLFFVYDDVRIIKPLDYRMDKAMATYGC